MKISDLAGPTGQFPQGKIHRTDEGEIRVAVGVKEGNVILDFGAPVTWLGLDPTVATQLGEALIRRAKEAVS